MKKTILLMMFLVPVFGWGQSEATPFSKPALKYAASDSVQSWVYCQIVGTQKLLSNKVMVEIDYGQRRKFFSDQRIRDEAGAVQDFNSMVDAMNYLGSKGWEFVQAYVVTLGNSNVYHWLLRANMNNPIFIPETKK